MKETVVSLNIFLEVLKQSLFSPFELLCVCRLCFFFMLAKFLIRYIEKFQ